MATDNVSDDTKNAKNNISLKKRSVWKLPISAIKAVISKKRSSGGDPQYLLWILRLGLVDLQNDKKHFCLFARKVTNTLWHT